MANNSEARGTVTFEAFFYQKHSALINSCLKNATEAYYGFQMVSSNYDGSFQFEASGRWTLDNTIPEILMPTSESLEEQKQYYQLYDLMLKDKVNIKFDYVEYEPGSEILQDQTVIAYPRADNDYMFNVETEDIYNYPYTDRCIIQQRFEDGYTDLNTSQEMLEKFRDAFMKTFRSSINVQDNFSDSNKLFDLVYSGVTKDYKSFDGAIAEWRLDDLEKLLSELGIIKKMKENR